MCTQSFKFLNEYKLKAEIKGTYDDDQEDWEHNYKWKVYLIHSERTPVVKKSKANVLLS